MFFALSSCYCCTTYQATSRFAFVQFTVAALDSGIPQKVVTKEVSILVIRDEFMPEFVNAPYTAPEVPENKPVGERVFQVQGRDQDQKVHQLVCCFGINIIISYRECLLCKPGVYSSPKAPF